jgi:hypothetical protein
MKWYFFVKDKVIKNGLLDHFYMSISIKIFRYKN